jgi:hypothetical protein
MTTNHVQDLPDGSFLNALAESQRGTEDGRIGPTRNLSGAANCYVWSRRVGRHPQFSDELAAPRKRKIQDFSKAEQRDMSGDSTIRARLAYNEIDDATATLLREYKDFIMAELPGVLDHFYDHVSKFEETAAFFKNREHMMGAKSAQLRHLGDDHGGAVR